MSIILEVTEEQAKVLLIVTGSMAGSDGSRGLFNMIRNKLRVVGPTPDPYINELMKTIIVYDSMIDAIKTM